MNDLVSRKAVIEELEKYSDGYKYSFTVQCAKEAVEMIPAAKIDLVDFFNDYCVHGNKLCIIVPVTAGDFTFDMTLIRDGRIGCWNDDYNEWLESLGLTVKSVFGGNDQLLITTNPVRTMTDMITQEDET